MAFFNENKTKVKIAESFIEAVSQNANRLVSVQEIAEKAQLNRQTFYYHFQDIRDLIEWICIDEVDNILEKKDECEKWEDKFLLIFRIMEEEKIFVKNIYYSVSVEVLRSNLYRLVYPIIYSEILEKSKGKNLREEDKKFITDFYKYSFVSIVLNWIDNGMHENPGLIVAKVSRLITGTIDHACLSVN